MLPVLPFRVPVQTSKLPPPSKLGFPPLVTDCDIQPAPDTPAGMSESHGSSSRRAYGSKTTLEAAQVGRGPTQASCGQAPRVPGCDRDVGAVQSACGNTRTFSLHTSWTQCSRPGSSPDRPQSAAGTPDRSPGAPASASIDPSEELIHQQRPMWRPFSLPHPQLHSSASPGK